MGPRAWRSPGKEWDAIGRIRSIQRYKQKPQRSVIQGDGEEKRSKEAVEEKKGLPAEEAV